MDLCLIESSRCHLINVNCVMREASMKHMKNAHVSVGQGIYSTLGDTPDLQTNSSFQLSVIEIINAHCSCLINPMGGFCGEGMVLWS